jgi:hypothetical protein
MSPDPYATFAGVLTGFDARFGAVRRLCLFYADRAQEDDKPTGLGRTW